MEDATQTVRLRAVETNVARLLKLFARHGVLEAA
jgi:hypothetical protein